MKFLEKGYQTLELEDAIRAADERNRDDLLVPKTKDRDDSFRFSLLTTYSNQLITQ